jgi:large subunit ribosomal protein L25
MEKIKLKVSEREAKTPNVLRQIAKLPATLYGPGEPSKSLQIDEYEFTRLPNAAYSHMIELDFGQGTPTNALIRNVQRKPCTGKVLNVELYRVRLDRKLTVTVPIRFSGSAPAVILGGQLVEAFQEAEIECLPNDIPDFIEVDLADLKEIDDAIHFADLKLGDNIKILNPLDEAIVKAVAPRAVVEVAATSAAEGAGAPAAGGTSEAPPKAAAKAPSKG